MSAFSSGFAPSEFGGGSLSTRISVSKPGYPASGKSFRISGSLSGYAAAPMLSYADDPPHPGKVGSLIGFTPAKGSLAVRWSPPTTGALYIPFPFGSGVTTRGFHFQHPGLRPGHHTVYVTDGKIAGSVGFGVSNSARVRINPFR